MYDKTRLLPRLVSSNWAIALNKNYPPVHIVNFTCRGPGCLGYYYTQGLSAGSSVLLLGGVRNALKSCTRFFTLRTPLVIFIRRVYASITTITGNNTHAHQ